MLAIGFVVTAPVYASSREHADHQEHGEGLDHRHHAALFLANTYSTSEDKSALSIGLDYEYRISLLFGTGLMYDYATPSLDMHVFVVPLYYHPGGDWRMFAGPGVESSSHTDHGHTSHEEKFLVRVGMMYSWHFTDRYSLTPTFEIDIVDGHQSYILGVGLGAAF
jgi:hypothetical protein